MKNRKSSQAHTKGSFWNLGVRRGADGSKHLDVHLHGVIDGGWDDDVVNTSDVISELQQHLDAKTIGVRINSVGGSAFGGVSLYNALQSHPADVVCTVEGLAASAASLVAMAGKTVMGRGAMMMIHPPATVAMGNAGELRKTADLLDKVQNGLASIYTAKTGKSLEEINNLLDEETWMTAEEAVASGFADEMCDAECDGGEEDPSTPESQPTETPESGPPQEDGDDGGDDDPEMIGSFVCWRGSAFPVASVPQQIVSRAKTQRRASPLLSVVPPPAPEAPLTRTELARRAPELLAAVLSEGRASGIAEERARLQAIDDLGVKGCAELVAAAKYGKQTMDAPALAMAVVKAGQVAGADLLALRRSESKPLAEIVSSAPDQVAAADEARIIQAIADGGNARRGGTIR